MNKISYEQYFKYLKARGLKGYLYRRYFIYPRICREIRGLVIDVGCGIGDFLSYRANTVGVDINPFNIEFCNSMGHEVYLTEGSHYPFSNMFFDNALIEHVIEHLEDPKPTLNEIYRILKPGGKLVVGVPGGKGYDADDDHKRYYDEASLVNCLGSAGFRLENIFYTPFKSDWLNSNLSNYCLFGVFERL